MKKVRVLVVDDSRISHAMIEDILARTNFEICGYAKTSTEAIEKFSALSPDVVTMDMNLPDADGMECSKKVLEADKNAKIVMISAMKDGSLINQGREIGISAFLQKPLTPNELIDTLAMVCNPYTDEVRFLEESYVRPFVNSLRKNIKNMMGQESTIVLEKAVNDKLEINGIAVVIGLTGVPAGRIVVYTDGKEMFNFARAILKTEGHVISEEKASECIEEAANIIAGHGVSMINNVLKDKELRITPPGTILGTKLSIVNPKMIAFNVIATTNLGEIKMSIGFAGGEQ